MAATASFLDARARGDRWLLRIDDLDIYRNVAGSEAAILSAIEAHGLTWDGPIIRQSERIGEYQAALDKLVGSEDTFYCSCSRRDLKAESVYPGTCRKVTTPKPDTAVRVRVRDASISFTDLIAGRQIENLASSCGDFIIRRRDGLIAYQLATAVDDGAEEITHVVRGGDLLDNTARQLYLMQLLGLRPPSYAHLPTLTQPDGMKLSKQSHAPALDNRRTTANLLEVFAYLGLLLPLEANGWTPAELLDWGTAHWSLGQVRGGPVEYRH